MPQIVYMFKIDMHKKYFYMPQHNMKGIGSFQQRHAYKYQVITLNIKFRNVKARLSKKSCGLHFLRF